MSDEGELQPGELFGGRFVIGRLLGAGESKRTYLAHDQKLDRSVAVSVVKPEALANDPGRAEREAKVLGRIGAHSNIVSLYDYGVEDVHGLHYMVFEYLAGGTLAEHLYERPLPEVLRTGSQITEGLAHLHNRGLIHRDVAPENIWFSQRGNAHLGDFDAAIPVDDQEKGRPVTTTYFSSPEQREGGALDVRSDLFSLGGVLCVLATGEQRPRQRADLRTNRPDLPALFVDLVAHLMAPSPEVRPVDASRVLDALGQIQRFPTIETLIAAGESETVEFKSSLRHPYTAPAEAYPGLSVKEAKARVKQDLQRSVTKTVAAFLNSKGGTLLIGVDDTGLILGIEPDICYLHKPDLDGWTLELQRVMNQALGVGVVNDVSITLQTCGDKTVAIVSCQPRGVETWHVGKEKGQEVFYVRAANGTEELMGSQLLQYARERWPR